MSLWNEEILPKHGSHVEVIDVGLRSEWLQIHAAQDKHQKSLRDSDVNTIKFIEEDKEFWEVDDIYSDNLNVSAAQNMLGVDVGKIIMRELYGLCPENLFKVLSHCPNLTSLYLNCPDNDSKAPDTEEMQNLSHNFLSLFADLKRLQHLKIRGPKYNYTSISAGCFIEPISHLPLLESLELVHVSADDGSEVDNLATCLHNLKNLKQLILKEVDVIDGS